MALEYFDTVYIRPLNTAASVAGVALSLYAMQLWSLKVIGSDPPLLGQLRRFSMILINLALCWSVYYSLDKDWQPWPPAVLLVIAVDMFLFTTVMSGHARKRREPSPGRHYIET